MRLIALIFLLLFSFSIATAQEDPRIRPSMLCSGIKLSPEPQMIYQTLTSESGMYLILVSLRFCNNSTANLMMRSELWIGGGLELFNVWDITPDMHYSKDVIVWIGWINAGNGIQIYASADTDAWDWWQGAAVIWECQGCQKYQIVKIR